MKGAIIFCVLGILYCTLNSCAINSRADSIMHQLYAGQYTLMSVMFLCCIFIVLAVMQNKKSSEKSDTEKQNSK